MPPRQRWRRRARNLLLRVLPSRDISTKEMSQLGSPYEAAYADASQQNAPAAAEMVVEDDGSSVPAWFARAQEKAKRPKNDDKPVHRSRYADALDAAVSASSAHFQEAERGGCIRDRAAIGCYARFHKGSEGAGL